MAYHLFKGEFHLFYRSSRWVGAKPDGDSIWFKPNNQDLCKRINGRKVKWNKGGFAQLRFEGVDALELHYSGSNHQEEHWTTKARDTLLEDLIGFKTVTYAPSKHGIPAAVRSANPHPIPGFILSRNVDPYGRPVVFVFVGGIRRKDGSDVWLDAELLYKSVNAQLMNLGLVYPGFYTGLPVDLRDALTEMKSNAVANRRGLWPDDVTNNGIKPRNLKDLSKYVIWPKIYRRLVEYFRIQIGGLKEFKNWLQSEPDKNDAVQVLPTQENSSHCLNDLLTWSATAGLKMTCDPENVVITPK